MSDLPPGVYESMYRKLYKEHMELVEKLPLNAPKIVFENSELLDANNRLQHENSELVQNAARLQLECSYLRAQLKEVVDALNNKEEESQQMRLSLHNIFSDNVTLRQQIQEMNKQMRPQYHDNPTPESSPSDVDPMINPRRCETTPKEPDQAPAVPMTMAMKLKQSQTVEAHDSGPKAAMVEQASCYSAKVEQAKAAVAKLKQPEAPKFQVNNQKKDKAQKKAAQERKPAEAVKKLVPEKSVPVKAPEPIKKPEPSLVAEKDIADVTKFLISHLTQKTTTEMLKKHFSKFGNVLDAYIPTVYGTSESKCFGYIVVPTKDLRFLNQKHMIDGVGVQISKEGTASSHIKTPTLLVSAGPQIMKAISEDDLRKFFSRFGKVASVRKFIDPATKLPSHYAFVEFASPDSTEKALKNLAYLINGHIICITKSRHEPHNK